MADGLRALNPLGYWPFSSLTGLTEPNAVGGTAASLLNGAAFGPAGVLGRGVRLDGVNDLVSVAHSAPYAPDAGAISLWFRPDALGRVQGLVSKNSVGLDAGGGFTVLLQADGTIAFQLESATATFTIQSTLVVAALQWSHVAITWGAAGMQLWINGVLAGSNAYTGGLGTSSGGTGADDPLVFGASTQNATDLSLVGASNFFAGAIDEAAFFTRQLTTADLGAVYANGRMGANLDPTALNDAVGVLENTVAPVTGSVLANDVDPNGDPLSVFSVAGSTAGVGAAVAGVYGILTLNADGSYSYALNTTAANVQALRAGQTVQDAFAYVVVDGKGGLSSASLVVTVTGENDAPVVTGEVRTITEDPTALTLTGNVLTNDRDLDGGVLAVSAVNGAAAGVGGSTAGVYGAITIAANGAYTYTLNNASAAVQGLKQGQVVSDVFTYAVSDGQGGVSTTSITVTITGRNDAPVIAADAAAVNYAAPVVTGNVLVNDRDVDGDVLRVDQVRGVAANVGQTLAGTYGTLRLGADGAYTYTLNTALAATIALAPGATASDSFSYRVTDGLATSNTVNLVIAVTGSNEAPILTAKTRAITEDAATLTLTGSFFAAPGDRDPDGGALSLTAVNGAAAPVGAVIRTQYGTLTITGNAGLTNTYSYLLDNASTAVQSLKAGQVVNDVFSYTVADGQGGSTTSSLTVAITGRNDAPVAVADAATVNAAGPTTITGNVLVNDRDIDGDVLRVDQVRALATNVGVPVAGTYGVLTLNADGSYSYALNTTAANVLALRAGQTVTEAFSYRATDGAAASNTVNLTITIVGQNDAPIISAKTNAIVEDVATAVTGAFIVTAAPTSDRDVDGGVLALASVAGGAATVGRTISGVYGVLTITGANAYSYQLDNTRAVTQGLKEGQVAPDVFAFSVSDGQGGVTTSSLTINVTGRNDAPVITGAVTGAATEDGATVALNALARASDADGDALTVVNLPASLPAGVSFNAATGTFTLDPANAAYQSLAAGATTTVTVAYGVSDGLVTAPASVRWTVTGTNDAPVVTGAVTGAATEDGALVRLNALANASDVDAGAVLSVVGVPATLPAGVTYDAATRSFALDPADAAFQSLAAGATTTVTVSYGVSDGIVTTPASVSWTVTGVNDAPVAANGAVLASVFGGDFALAPQAPTDADADPLTITIVSLPTNGVVRLADGGVVSTGAVLSLQAFQGLRLSPGSAPGLSALVYDVSDGAATTRAALTIDLRAGDLIGSDANEQLVAGPGVTFVSGGGGADTITATLGGPTLTVDGGAGKDTLTISAGPAARDLTITGGAVLSVDAAGVSGSGVRATGVEDVTLRLAPGAGVIKVSGDLAAAGLAPSTLTVILGDGGKYFDGAAQSGAGVRYVVQGGAGDDTIIGAFTDDVLSGGAGNDVLAGGGGADVLDGGDGVDTAVFAGLRTDYEVIETGTVTTVRRLGETAVTTLTGIEKLAFNTAPVAVADSATTNEDTPVVINVLANDTDVDAGDVLRVSAIAGTAVVAGQTVSLAGGAFATLNADGTITYAPAANVNGAASFTYTVSDGRGGAADGLATVQIAPVAGVARIAFDQGAGLTPLDAGNVKVNGPVSDPPGPSNDYSSVATFSDGSYVVAWAHTFDDPALGFGGFGYGVFLQRYSAAGLAIGGEVRVNTTTDLDQTFPSATALAGGGLLVTWSSQNQDGSGYGIFAQQFDASGARIGGEFQVNTFTASHQVFSSAAALGDGGYVVTWSSYGQDGSQYGIYSQRYAPSGAAIGPEVRVNTTTSGSQANSSAVGLADGGYVVAWSAAAADGSGIGAFFQRYDASGAPVGVETQANTTSTNGVYYASAAVASLNDGGFVVTWAGLDGSLSGIFSQRYDAAGVAVGTERRVNTNTVGTQTYPSAIALPDGGYVVSWTSAPGANDGPQGIYAQRYDQSGAPVGGEIALSAPGRFSIGLGSETTLSDAPLAVTRDGVLIQTFYGDGAVYIQRFDTHLPFHGAEDGGPIALPISVTPGEPGETITEVVLSGLPSGSVLSAGRTTDGGSTWTFAGAPPRDLALTPPANFNGVFTLTVTATERDGDSTATISAAQTVTVTATNDAPVANPDSVTTLGDTPVVINVLANDTDVDAGDVLRVSAIGGTAVVAGQTVSLAGGAFATLNADGTITYAPAANVNGAASFTYTVSDGRGGSADGTVNVAVTPVAAQPVIAFANTAPFTPLDAQDVLVSSVRASRETLSTVQALADGGYVVAWSGFGVGQGFGDTFLQRYSATGGRVGAEIKVNSTNSVYEWSPSIASTGDGGYMVAWVTESGDGSGRGISAQRFAADGSRAGGEFRVNTTTAGSQQAPTLTEMANGGVLAVWYSDAQDGSGTGIIGQRFAQDGAKIGGEFQINTTTPGDQFTPAVATLPNGGFVVSWVSFGPDATYAIMAQRLTADGALAGSEVVVSSGTAGFQLYPDVAALADGGYVITWSSDGGRDGDSWGVFAQRYSDTGAAVGATFQVNTYTASQQRLSSVLSLPDGGFVITWSSLGQDGSGFGIFGQRYDGAGNRVGPETQLNATAVGNQFNDLNSGGFALALTTNGTLVQLFTDDQSVYLRRFDTLMEKPAFEDQPFSLPIRVTAGGAGETIAQTVLSGLPVGSILSAGTTTDGGATWTFAGAPPADLTLTPPLNYNGAFTLTVTATERDGSASAVASATHLVSVGAVNDAPIANPDSAATLEDTPVVINVLANDTDVDAGDVLRVSAIAGTAVIAGQTVSLAGGAQATLNADGTITYAPAANVNGAASFSYTVSDGHGGTSDGLATVQIAPVADTAGISFGGLRALNATDVKVNTTPVNDTGQSASSIAALSDGGYIVTWASTSGALGLGVNGIYAQRFAADGTPRGVETLVAPVVDKPPSNFAHNISTAVTGLAGGGYVVTWSYEDDNVIHAKLYDSAGVGSDIWTSPPGSYSSLSPLKDGGFIITWSVFAADYDVLLQRFNASGQPVGAPVTVNTTTSGHQYVSEAAGLADGGYVVTWTAWGQDAPSIGGDLARGVFAQRYNAAGAPIGGEFQVNTTAAGEQFSQSVAALADGGFVVTWQSNQNGDYDIYAQRYAANGAAVGREFLVNSSTFGAQVWPSVTAAGDGFVISWTGQGGHIVAQFFGGDGVRIGRETQVDVAPGTSFQNWTGFSSSTLATTTSGAIVQAYNSIGGGAQNVYVRSFAPDLTLAGLQNHPIALPIAVAPGAPGETISKVILSGLPAGSTLSAGTTTDGGVTWTFAGAPPADLTLTPPLNYSGAFTLTVTATEQDGSASAVASATHLVSVGAVNLGANDDTLNLTLIQQGDGPKTTLFSNIAFDGGAGVDTVNLSGSSLQGVASIDIDLARGTLTIGGVPNVLTNFENVIGASSNANNIAGSSTANSLTGGSLADVLYGGGGNDTLQGGSGADTFVYLAANEGRDSIVDFVSGEDKLQVSATGFGGGLVAGVAASLVSGLAPVAADGNGAFLYHSDTGQLYWDPDGTGANAPILLATLAGAPALTTSDILVGA